MKQWYSVAPIYPVFLFLLAFLLTGSETYEVSGKLVDGDGSAIAGHRVLLLNESDDQIATDQTDSEGRFTLSYQKVPGSAQPGYGSESPSEFKLGSSYPNPFNPRTTVPFEAPVNTNAVIAVYNILGQEVIRTRAEVSKGSHEIVVNLGAGLSQGQYLLRVQGEGYSLTRSMTFISAGVGGGKSEIRVQPAGQTSNRVSGSMHPMDDEMEYRVVIEETDRYQSKEVTIASSENLDMGSLVLATKQEPLDKLPGDEEEAVVNATYNLSAELEISDEEFSVEESEEELSPVYLRTQIEVAIAPDATTSKVNELIAKYGANIVGMIGGRRFLILNIPDPGDMTSYNQTLSEIESEEIVDNVYSARIPMPDILPNQIRPLNEDGTVNVSDIKKVQHHLAIRGHAAWNLQGAIQDEPWLIIVDDFGDGVPDERFQGDFVNPDDFYSSLFFLPSFLDFKSSHGYHVLGIINASHNREPKVAGIFPGNLRIRAVDTNRRRNLSFSKHENDVIKLVEEIKRKDNNANIVVNVSLGATGYEKKDGERWYEKLNPDPETSLEDKFILFTSAGNVQTSSMWDTEAKENSPFAFAALGDMDKPNVTNTHVVENMRMKPENPTPDMEGRPYPNCRYFTFINGTLSAIGSAGEFDEESGSYGVYSLGDDGQDGISARQGTSQASPQAAGVAAYMWAVNPSLEVAEIMELLKLTAKSISPKAQDGCIFPGSVPAIDAYAAVLAAGGMNARKVLLDVTETGTFDEADIEKFLTEFEEQDGALDYSRYDLNGDGKTGGDGLDRFDLNHNMEYGTVSLTIEDVEMTFDETALTDLDILCYYAYSDLFEGDEEQRAELLEGQCFEECNGTITNPVTGRTWMDRNLGASRAATSSTDSQAYGDLYQWGRAADGHQKRNSSTTSTLSNTDQPGHGDFIIGSSDWRSPQNDNLWQGVNGVNNPCPAGYRLPTEAEWNAERNSWSSNNAAGAFGSPLKLPMAGYRSNSSGSLFNVGSYGRYWSSTVSGSFARSLRFTSVMIVKKFNYFVSSRHRSTQKAWLWFRYRF